jgi:hypothetical protein
MPEVRVIALGEVRRQVGFSQREIMFEGATVRELLRSIATKQGGSLEDLLVCENRLRGDYAVVIEGLALPADQLERRLAGGENVVTMAVIRHLSGG